MKEYIFPVIQFTLLPSFLMVFFYLIVLHYRGKIKLGSKEILFFPPLLLFLIGTLGLITAFFFFTLINVLNKYANQTYTIDGVLHLAVIGLLVIVFFLISRKIIFRLLERD